MEAERCDNRSGSRRPGWKLALRLHAGHDDPVVQIARETDIECMRQVALLPHVELTRPHQRLAALTAARLAS